MQEGHWLLDDAPVLMAILDESLNCQAVSRKWRDLRGLSSVISLDQLLRPSGNPGLRAQLQSVLDGGNEISNVHVHYSGGDGPVAKALAPPLTACPGRTAPVTAKVAWWQQRRPARRSGRAISKLSAQGRNGNSTT